MKFPVWYAGKTYTATNYSIDYQKFLDIAFTPGRTIAVDIYDPKFFLPSDKVLTIPGLRSYLKPGLEYWANTVAVLYSLLDRPGHRCQGDRQYSFTQCIEVESFLVSLNLTISLSHKILTIKDSDD